LIQLRVELASIAESGLDQAAGWSVGAVDSNVGIGVDLQAGASGSHNSIAGVISMPGAQPTV